MAECFGQLRRHGDDDRLQVSSNDSLNVANYLILHHIQLRWSRGMFVASTWTPI